MSLALIDPWTCITLCLVVAVFLGFICLKLSGSGISSSAGVVSCSSFFPAIGQACICNRKLFLSLHPHVTLINMLKSWNHSSFKVFDYLLKCF